MIQIKTCTRDNIDELLRVVTQSYREHYAHYWSDNGDAYINSNFNPDQLGQEMSNPNSTFFLISQGSRSVGILKINMDQSLDKYTAGETLELERIYLLKDASGKGVGKSAIDYVKDLAIQKGKKYIWLKTMEKSNAAQFYRKLGFRVIEEMYLNFKFIKPEYRKMFVMLLEM